MKKLLFMVSAAALLTACSTAKVGCKARCYSKDTVVISSDTYFAFDSATLTAGDRTGLDSVVTRLKANPDETVTVKGYTDDVGSAEYNLNLSKKRANAVAAYLEGKGISSSRITTEGLGETNFVACNKTAEGRAKNRRAEIEFD